MKKINFRALLSVITTAFLLSSCAPHGNYTQDMQYKIHKFAPAALAQLKPAFQKAGVSYPPEEITLLVFKNERRMELWARSGMSDPWRHIKNYPVLAASGGPGPKLRDMDRQVPEGIYKLEALNPDSRFDLSMELNYPNSEDQYHARMDGRTDLGGEIFIHGNKLSIGCIAIGNPNIEQLFVLVDEVGMRNVTVIVAPNDLRYEKPLPSKEKVTWLPQLYGQIYQALQPFKQ